MVTDGNTDILIQNTLSQNIARTDVFKILNSNYRPTRELMMIYTCAIMEVETKLKVLEAELSLDYEHNPIENIKTRLKSLDGIIEKAEKRKIPLNLESIEKNIHDIAGVRVICSYIEDIYQVSNWLLEQDDIRLIEKKDYIKEPKKNGYRSLHLIVEVPVFLHNSKKWMKVEVQLRTIAMEFWASLEHKAYYKKDVPNDVEQEIFSDLTKCADVSAELDLKMQEIKKRIFLLK